MQETLKKIYDYSLEEIMGERFGRYAKTIIQDRAIPDVRDGLKPVQRRILYAMYKSKNTFDHSYKKSGETVGEVMGKYHPHGDSSIYEAMVRMSQWWKQNACFVDMHGNNGSMDGDPPAAYRYTEARLSKISNEMLKDLDKETVPWAPNYADTLMEPTVLPAKYPNLLVNGTTGISAGYATNIPPHNLAEIIDATIKRIDSPNCQLDTIMNIVQGPDFPTGGIIEGKNGIKEAYETGRGRIIVKSKVRFESNKKIDQMIISEIPFEVNKGLLVKKIDEIRLDKKIDGIIEVRDESDREDPVRIVIDLKTGVNKDLILNYLLKNTDLQISYNYNMVAIVNRTPKTLGILDILDAYIVHDKEVITKRTAYELKTYKLRYHIVEGLIKAISILDEVIKTIRASKNKQESKENLVKKFDFTLEQAEAIVTLQLYRLSNTDIAILEEEAASLQAKIKTCEEILGDENILKNVMKNELREIKKNYSTPRKTLVKEEITEIKVDMKEMISDEKVIVIITNDGYVKRVSLKSYKAATDETTIKPGDFITNKFIVSTLDTLLLFTNKGNYLYVPIHIIPESKWKDLGKHISNVIMIKEDEKIVGSLILKDQDRNIMLFTKNGMIKQVNLKSFIVTRYNKPLTAIKLKDNDELVNVSMTYDDVLFVTHNGYYLKYKENEVPTIGVKGSGVKGINLKDDYVIFASCIKNDKEYLNIFTNYSTGKRLKLNDLVTISRAKKGNMLFKKTKSKDYKILNAYLTDSKDINILKYDTDLVELKNSEIPIMDLNSTGSIISKKKYDLVTLKPLPIELNNNNNNNVKQEEPKEEKQEEQQLSFADFTENFKI